MLRGGHAISHMEWMETHEHGYGTQNFAGKCILRALAFSERSEDTNRDQRADIEFVEFLLNFQSRMAEIRKTCHL
jgi:hypothetical protein